MDSSRSLRQEELDSIFRQEFIDRVLKAAEGGRTVRFLVCKNNYNLVEVKTCRTGEYEFSVADKHRFTYRMSDFVGFLESLYDSKARIIALNGEAEITAERATANADADPDHDYEIAKRQKASETADFEAGVDAGFIEVANRILAKRQEAQKGE